MGERARINPYRTKRQMDILQRPLSVQRRDFRFLKRYTLIGFPMKPATGKQRPSMPGLAIYNSTEL